MGYNVYTNDRERHIMQLKMNNWTLFFAGFLLGAWLFWSNLFCDLVHFFLDIPQDLGYNIYIENEGLAFILETTGTSPHYLERVNTMKRIESNIVNLAFVITNQPAKDTKGRQMKTQGVELNQAIVNGQSTGVSLRTMNGATKSTAIKLDEQSLRDLLEAVNEVLAAGSN